MVKKKEESVMIRKKVKIYCSYLCLYLFNFLIKNKVVFKVFILILFYIFIFCFLFLFIFYFFYFLLLFFGILQLLMLDR